MIYGCLFLISSNPRKGIRKENEKASMMTKILLTALLWLTTTMSQAQGQQLNQHKIINSGKINLLPLSEFAPENLQKACTLLLNNNYDEAAREFRQELGRNQNNLLAFVGLAQADLTFWPGEVKRLETQLKQNPENTIARFKLGTLLFYQAEVKYRSGGNADAAQEIDRATRLLSKSWREIKLPIPGLLYIEAHSIRSPNAGEEFAVLDQLIASLTGRQAYSSYQKAKQAGWQALPPSIQGTSPANLKPLRGVIRLAKSLSSVRFGHGVMHGNQVQMVYDPVPPERQRQTEYFLRWRQAIDRALQAH